MNQISDVLHTNWASIISKFNSKMLQNPKLSECRYDATADDSPPLDHMWEITVKFQAGGKYLSFPPGCKTGWINQQWIWCFYLDAILKNSWLYRNIPKSKTMQHTKLFCSQGIWIRDVYLIFTRVRIQSLQNHIWYKGFCYLVCI